jgi:hypothetical protein
MRHKDASDVPAEHPRLEVRELKTYYPITQGLFVGRRLRQSGGW